MKLICSKTIFFTMKSDKLNTANPDHITYEHPPVEIAVLGGIRLEGLDRMRVTLKVQIEHLNLRHNLDLYNDNQTEKLIRKIAERIEIGTSVVAAALTELTDALERYPHLVLDVTSNYNYTINGK